MFGFGMVLASGCGSKTLVRIGGGNLKSLVVFVRAGVAAFATLRGIAAVLRVATVDAVALTLPAGQDLPSLLAARHRCVAPVRWRWCWAAGLGLALVAWALARPEGRSGEVLLAGLGIGAVVVGVWWVSGRLGYVAEHPETLEESLPRHQLAAHGVAELRRAGGLRDGLADLLQRHEQGADHGHRQRRWAWCSGSAAVALATRSFRWEGFAGTEDTANHLVGAVLMGVGGVTAMGCTVGQGLSRRLTLALGSFIALGGIVAGARARRCATRSGAWSAAL